MKNKIYLLIILTLIISCKKEDADVAKIEFIKEQEFGKIKVGDTIIKLYEIKNISSNVLKIKNIQTSCGCTVAKLKDSIINQNSSTQIKATFIARKDNIGLMNKSIVMDANTIPNFTVMYLKGEVIK